MRVPSLKKPLSRGPLMPALVVLMLGASVGGVCAHESRQVGEYELLVGWMEEPAYEGYKNGIDFRVTSGDENGHGHGHNAGHNNGHDDTAAGVEGLQETMQVEVTHDQSGTSEVFDLRDVWGQPGHYTADLIPTRPGAYEFRFFGSVEGMDLDETFVSYSLGGGFDDVVSSGEIHFPERLAEAREVEDAVRGALSTAESAQGTAAALEDRLAGIRFLAIAALLVAIISAAATAYAAWRRRWR